jgi:hypothetical protein
MPRNHFTLDVFPKLSRVTAVATFAADFRRPDEVGQFLEEVERTLTVGGWRQESAEEE